MYKEILDEVTTPSGLSYLRLRKVRSRRKCRRPFRLDRYFDSIVTAVMYGWAAGIIKAGDMKYEDNSIHNIYDIWHLHVNGRRHIWRAGV